MKKPKLAQTTSPVKSPVKSSPTKKVRPNDENASPDKSSLSSPTKPQSPVKKQQPESCKQDRKSQQRRQKVEESLQVPEEKSDESSGEGKHCRLSPLRRMTNLENQENQENQENIETTYQKVHDSEGNPDVSFSQEPPKSILG